MPRLTLQKESDFYQANYKEWMKEHAGQHVLIKGKEVIDFYPTENEALLEGVKRYPRQAFYVGEISPRVKVRRYISGSRPVRL